MDDDAIPHSYNDGANTARVLFDDELKANCRVRAQATVVAVENGRFTIRPIHFVLHIGVIYAGYANKIKKSLKIK